MEIVSLPKEEPEQPKNKKPIDKATMRVLEDLSKEEDPIVREAALNTIELIRLSQISPEKISRTKCPLCGWLLPRNRMLNELIKHMNEHGKISDVVVGEFSTVRIDGKKYILEEV